MDEDILKSMTDTIVATVHPDGIILFGSRAMGREHPASDADFLVIQPDSETARLKRRKITGDIYRSLKSFPIAKDILVYTRSEADHWRGISGHVISAAFRDGKQLYARQ
jgi:uncharacterized protein